jgi:hypothetical protein
LEDEKEGHEIIIKGAIKKSSLKGVHEFLDEKDDLDQENSESISNGK